MVTFVLFNSYFGHRVENRRVVGKGKCKWSLRSNCKCQGER